MIVSISYISKLRLRELNNFVQDHLAGKVVESKAKL